MHPSVHAFFDTATNTVSYVVHDPSGTAAAIIDSVLDFDHASGRTDTASAARFRHGALRLPGRIAGNAVSFDPEDPRTAGCHTHLRGPRLQGAGARRFRLGNHRGRAEGVGSVLFGIGWGLSGLCPGPALAAATFNGAPGLVFLAAMALGMWAAPP